MMDLDSHTRSEEACCINFDTIFIFDHIPCSFKDKSNSTFSLCVCVWVCVCLWWRWINTQQENDAWKCGEHSTPTSKRRPHGEVMVIHFEQMLCLHFARLGHIWRLLCQGARGRGRFSVRGTEHRPLDPICWDSRGQELRLDPFSSAEWESFPFIRTLNV